MTGLHIWFGAMLAGGALLAVVAAATRRMAWLAAAALVAGSAAQLGLTEPLWFGSLQLRPSNGFSLICYAVLAAQAGVVALALACQRRPGLWRAMAKALASGRAILLAVLLLGALVAPMAFLQRHEYGAFAKQVVATAALLLLNGANLALLAALLPEGLLAGLSRQVDRVLATTGRLLPWGVALWVFLVTLALNMLAFDHMPRLPDEVAYLFQARTFALGHLFAAAPAGPLAAALQYDWISISGGKWFSIFPPGWPALLAIGELLGAPWLVNPVLAALAVPVGHALVTRAASARLAVMASLLLAVSPWYLAMGASFMSHPLTLLLVLTGWLLMLRDDALRPFAWFVAGCLMGWLFLTRPLEGIVIGGLTGLWAIGRADRRAVSGWLAVAVYGLGCIVVGSLIFPYNDLLVGHPLVTPIDHYFDLLWHPGANRLGFGADIGSPDNWGGIDIWPGHGPLEALVQAQFNLKSLNVELFGWAIGSLILLFVHLLWGKLSRFDLGMIAVIVVTILAYGLYWFNGGFYIGPRYWFMTLWPSIFLSARGLQTAAGMLRGRGIAQARERIAALALFLGLLAVTSFLPWRAVTKYWEFRGFNSDYRELVAEGRLGDGLIFVTRGDMGEFGSAFMLNDPELRGRLFVKDQGPVANARVMAQFPGRRAYRIMERGSGGGPNLRRIEQLVPAGGQRE